MALTNKQKRTVIETAKANGYKGDYTSLFNQVESEQVFNNTAPGIPVPELTKEDITFTEPDDHKFNLKSLLVDRTPHRFNDNDNFITKDHSVKPNNKSILRFLNDPEYTPTAEPNMGEHGGFHFDKKFDYSQKGIKERQENSKLTKDEQELGLSFAPGFGELIDAKNTYNDLKEGDYKGAALNAAGFLLPIIPGRALKTAYNKFFGNKKLKNISDKKLKNIPEYKLPVNNQKLLGNKKVYRAVKPELADNIMKPLDLTLTDKVASNGVKRVQPEANVAWFGPNKGAYDESGKQLFEASLKWKKPYHIDIDEVWSSEKLQKIVDAGHDIIIAGSSQYSQIPLDKNVIQNLKRIRESGGFAINKREDGGIKKYDEGGTPHEHPHPEVETNDEGLPNEGPPRRRLYVDYLKSEDYGPSQLNNTLKMQEFLGVEQDGQFGEGTKNKMFSWSNKNLTSLPVYNPEFRTMNIKCKGMECSEQTTNTLQLLYPQLNRNQLVPDDSWFRRDNILSNGGRDIWSQNTQNINKESRNERSDFTGIPPMEVWNTFQVGDIVSMDSMYDENDEGLISRQGYTSDGSEHTGFIIGRHHETGIPLVMHGYEGQMEVDPINELTLGSGTFDGNSTYIISGISRPSALGDGETNNYTFDKLSFFLEKDDFATHNYFSFNEDYLANMNEDEREMADQFTNFFNGSTSVEYIIDEGRANNTHQVLSENDSLVRLAETSSRSMRAGESRFGNSFPIQKIANITGYSKDEVSKAAMMTWGFYQNETGDAQGIRMGKGMEWIKDNMSTKNAAKLKALKKGDITWTPFSNFGGIFSFDINEEDYMYSAQQEPSRGILRIKYNMQTTDADDNTTRVGFWADQYGISRSDLTSEDDNENTLITGTPGKSGVQNSFAMGTLLTLSYYENIRRKPGYDPETETYKGVPIDYVVATMHKGLNLNSQSGDGNTILKNLQKGNRDYSNVTINNANQLSYTKTQLDTKFLEANSPVEAVLDRKIISENNKPFKTSIQFMNRARNADGSIPKPITQLYTGESLDPNKT